MTAAIESLTDKEKEALRLLVEGHDAKSSANLLGLSVHTVNDRLRNARRKLGVSSSREAARILRDAEGETPQTIPQNPPQNPAHTSFGMADGGERGDTAVLDQRSQKAPNRWVWLAGGMFIMSLLIAAAIFAAVSSSGEAVPSSSAAPSSNASESTSTRSTSPADAESYAKAQAFLAELDEADWNGSWKYTGEFVQSQMSASQWTKALSSAREPLGVVEARGLTAVEKANELSGLPTGDYEVLLFTTRFEASDRQRYERVVMARNGDTFEVIGYFIQ